MLPKTVKTTNNGSTEFAGTSFMRYLEKVNL